MATCTSVHAVRNKYFVCQCIYAGHYKENIVVQKGSSNNPFEKAKQNVTFGALQIEVGRQWVFGDKFILDIYEGLGYAVDNKEENYQPYGYNTNNTYYQETAAYNYGNFRLGKSPSLSFTIGLRIGLLVK